MVSGRKRQAVVATSGLTIVLLVVGLVATLGTARGRILSAAPLVPPLAMVLLLGVAFAFAELALLHVELRRQAYSFSLSGIALLLGVLFSDIRFLVLARLTGAALVFAWQRLPPLKTAYNLGAYTLEAGLVGFGLHRFLGSGIQLTFRSAVICYLTIGLVDLLMSSLVLLVISWHQGRVSITDAAEVFVPAAVLGLFSTLAGLAIVMLLDDGTLGVVLIIGFATMTALLYHGYLNLRNRHQSLALIHEFVEQSVGAGTVEDLARVLLSRTRRLLNAGEVGLVIRRGSADLRLASTEDEALTTRHSQVAEPGDWLLTRVRENIEAIVVPRNTRERGMRQWLITHHARDAMIVPLPPGGIEGVLIVKDRMGDANTFTADDLTLLQTLAGHLAVALRSTQLVQQLRHDATHDALTGLANRVLLTEQIEVALSCASVLSAGSRDCRPADLQSLDLASRSAVLLLDLDKFKEVNDALGHHVGDTLLQVVGSRIRTCVPARGTVARLGGDEFAVLLPMPNGTELDAREEAQEVAEAVLSALISPIALPGAVVSTRASIGIALGSRGCNPADLLRHADTAMYAAKSGQSPVVVYSAELDRGRAERLTLLADLAVAIEREELELRYQPQLDLHTGEMTSVEALVRWRHPEHGLLHPDEFIPLAESSGLIEELTNQVLRQALRQCRAWRDDGLDLVVAVNLSARNVNNASLAENVAAVLAEVGLPADRLVMEITESSVMGDPHRTVPILQRLADIGVTLSLDDFGTGYSSLAYLQRLPVREVKIDKSFVMGLTGGSQEHASSVLVRSILTLGGNLNLRVVAEGVESAEVVELLRRLGCDAIQGYHIARPLLAEEVGLLISTSNNQVRECLPVVNGQRSPGVTAGLRLAGAAEPG
jgi:diguanylate cyclase (GGDEF)-like protein